MKQSISLNNNNFPVENSIKLCDEDNLRRTVIQDIRNYFEVDKKSISSQFEIEFDRHFNEEILNLQKYVKQIISKQMQINLNFKILY